MRKILVLFLVVIMLMGAMPVAATNNMQHQTYAPMSLISTEIVDSLLYSSVYDWTSSDLEEYNCFGYALGLNTWVNVSSISGTVDYLTQTVMNDILSLGYCSVRVLSGRPTSSSLSSGETGICFRRGTGDIHFMKLVGSVWRHKPGSSGILTFNTTPEAAPWVFEGVDPYTVSSVQTFRRDDNYTYADTIVYLAYRKDHITDSTYTGVNYHVGNLHMYEHEYECSVCGETWIGYVSISCGGPPCIDFMRIVDEGVVE